MRSEDPLPTMAGELGFKDSEDDLCPEGPHDCLLGSDLLPSPLHSLACVSPDIWVSIVTQLQPGLLGFWAADAALQVPTSPLHRPDTVLVFSWATAHPRGCDLYPSAGDVFLLTARP